MTNVRLKESEINMALVLRHIGSWLYNLHNYRGKHTAKYILIFRIFKINFFVSLSICRPQTGQLSDCQLSIFRNSNDCCLFESGHINFTGIHEKSTTVRIEIFHSGVQCISNCIQCIYRSQGKHAHTLISFIISLYNWFFARLGTV